MKNNIYVIAQGFYGNRTFTEIDKKNVDRFILGYLDNNINVTEQIDRTIINVPNTDNIVIVYNKYEDEIYMNENYKPLVIIPGNNIKIYSRCIVCRMNENGELESLENDDCDKFMKYLSE